MVTPYGNHSSWAGCLCNKTFYLKICFKSDKNEILVKSESCTETFFFLFRMASLISASGRKKQVRFQAKDDMILLREALAKNPFKNKLSWTEISTTLSSTRSVFHVDTRRVRERTSLLIEQHKKLNAESLKRYYKFKTFWKKMRKCIC